MALSVVKDLLAADGYIADIGGGEGIFLDALQKEGFSNSIGVDLFAPFAGQNMVRGDLCNLPLADNSMDALTCFDVLEHIPLDGQGRAAGELARVLKPGGIAIISVPNMAHLKSRLQFLFAGRPWRNKLDKHPGELAACEREHVFTKAGFLCMDKVGIHMTLSYNPRPLVPFGGLLTRIMFSTATPLGLCWTAIFLFCKPPAPESVMKLRRPLKRALYTYRPVKEDPTCK